MIRHTLIDLNPVKLSYYPFIFMLDKCSGRNYVDDLSTKICNPNKTKDVNVTVFNMLTNKNEAITIVKHVSCDCECKFNSQACNSDQKWNNDNCQCECKRYCMSPKKKIVGILEHVFMRMASK